MALLPSEIPSGLLTGNYNFVNEDTLGDADANPQLLVVSGTVTITASVKALRMSAKKSVLVPLRFDCKFDNNGDLVPESGDGIGVRLPATDSDEFDLKNWTWTARFNLVAVESGFDINLDPVIFTMPAGGTVDLSEIIPSNPSAGVVTLRGPAGVSGGTSIVTVTTGSEARPEAPVVFWIGGETQPTNMQTGDVWFKVGETEVPPGGDTTAPAQVTGLTLNSATHTSLSVSWTAASDNVGVTGYDVQVNGVSAATPTGTSVTINSLTADTTYSVRVRARDAAGNWGALSTAGSFSTAAAPAGPQTYSVFAGGTYPVTLSKSTEASPIELSTGFYTFGAPATGWRSRGMRLYVPGGASVPSTATCRLRVLTGSTLDMTVTADKTATMTGIAAGQWNDVQWDSAVTLAAGTWFYLSYNFGNGDYLAGGGYSETGYVLSSETGNFVLGDQSDGTRKRNYFRIGSNTQVEAVDGMLYGIDALIDKGA